MLRSVSASGLLATVMTALIALPAAAGSPYDYRHDLPGYFNWSGLYAGAHVSWLSTDDQDNTVEVGAAGDIDNDGDVDGRDAAIFRALSNYFEGGDSVMGGGHIGFNMQTDRWLYGLEADISFGDTFEYLGSIRGRAGLIMPTDVYIYGTAGIGFLSIDRNDDVFAPFPDLVVSEEGGQAGLVFGGGFESTLSDQLILGLEVLYYTFDDEVTVSNRELEFEQDFVTLRGRISYKLGAQTYSLK